MELALFPLLGSTLFWLWSPAKLKTIIIIIIIIITIIIIIIIIVLTNYWEVLITVTNKSIIYCHFQHPCHLYFVNSMKVYHNIVVIRHF